jgi:hypothetical protein
MTRIYSEPKQNHKGLWVCEVTAPDGRWLETMSFTTKKRLLEYIKAEKQVAKVREQLKGGQQ